MMETRELKSIIQARKHIANIPIKSNSLYRMNKQKNIEYNKNDRD